MQFIQSLSGTYFEKNIPDIILTKNAETDVDVIFSQSGNTILSENYVFDTDGYIYIRDISQILSAYLSAQQSISGDLILTTGVLVPFSIQVGTTTFNFSVLHSEADMPDALNAGTFVSQNFLTRLSREKRTAINRNEYLSYIHFVSMAEVSINYKIIYLLNSVITENTGILKTVQANANDICVTFNASLATVLEAASLSDVEVIQYDLWFSYTNNGEEKASNVFTHFVDPNTYRNKRHFVFENSFGMLETFTATGIIDDKKTNAYNLANIQNRYRKTSQDFVSEKTVNTGYLSDNETEWLNDILLSYNVGIYTPGVSGMSEEITLTEHDKTDSENNTLQAFKFSYRRAKNNHLLFTAAAKGIFVEAFDQTYN